MPSSKATARWDFPEVFRSSTAWARYSTGYLCLGIGSSSTGLTPRSRMSHRTGSTPRGIGQAVVLPLLDLRSGRQSVTSSGPAQGVQVHGESLDLLLGREVGHFPRRLFG